MQRNIYFRIFIVAFVVAMSFLLFSYVRARSTDGKSSDPCNESGKCGGSKAKSEIILLESLTRNLLTSNG
jgi:hypothetical protein